VGNGTTYHDDDLGCCCFFYTFLGSFIWESCHCLLDELVSFREATAGGRNRNLEKAVSHHETMGHSCVAYLHAVFCRIVRIQRFSRAKSIVFFS